MAHKSKITPNNHT